MTHGDSKCLIFPTQLESIRARVTLLTCPKTPVHNGEWEQAFQQHSAGNRFIFFSKTKGFVLENIINLTVFYNLVRKQKEEDDGDLVNRFLLT